MERHYLPLLACAGALAPFFVYPLFAMKVLILSLLAAAYNLLFGYVGLLAFGHAAFFGVAAYVAAETAKSLGLTPELSILAGIFCAGALGYVFALIAIRRQGLYFAMITLALAQLAYFYAVQAPWTGGDEGLHGIPRNKLFGLIDLSHPLAMYFLVLALFLGGFFVIQRTIRSPFGEILQAIRENEPRAISLGYNADQFKTVAFVISACLSGLAGALNALAFQYASLADMSFHFSGEILLMVLIGGVGTLLGPIAGAIVLAAMQHYLATSGALVIVLQGAIFVVCILAFPRGIAGTFGMWIEKWRVERRLSGTSETAEPGRGAVSVPPRPREVDAGEAMPALPDATN
ncbi:MAG TPA: branched-chain amino acid ABC transporter permease [Bosea sp. (in: a-proteobacteria)]|nr:branched-chain amino acid ABC transporter permease [Bosea sp. (in: a-proteobacteria)]